MYKLSPTHNVLNPQNNVQQLPIDEGISGKKQENMNNVQQVPTNAASFSKL